MITTARTAQNFARALHDSPNISGPRRFKHHQNSTKGPPKRGRKEEHCGGRGEKTRNFGLPTLLGPILQGAQRGPPRPPSPLVAIFNEVGTNDVCCVTCSLHTSLSTAPPFRSSVRLLVTIASLVVSIPFARPPVPLFLFSLFFCCHVLLLSVWCCVVSCLDVCRSMLSCVYPFGLKLSGSRMAHSGTPRKTVVRAATSTVNPANSTGPGTPAGELMGEVRHG